MPLDLIRPGRRIGIFEVGHVAVGARVERVDDHLALHRAGDLDAPALQIGWQCRDRPVALPDLSGFRQEIGPVARIKFFLTGHPARQQFLATRLERAMQLGGEGECLGRKDLRVFRGDRGGNGDAAR